MLVEDFFTMARSFSNRWAALHKVLSNSKSYDRAHDKLTSYYRRSFPCIAEKMCKALSHESAVELGKKILKEDISFLGKVYGKGLSSVEMYKAMAEHINKLEEENSRSAVSVVRVVTTLPVYSPKNDECDIPF